jgi:predicted dehydrogenase
MSRLSRRKFLQTTAAASTAFSLFTIAGTKASGRVICSNDTIRVGVAGINGRGGAHIDELAAREGVEITYLIDVDETRFQPRMKDIRTKRAANKLPVGAEPRCVQDIREALNDKNLDAITIATPNHWHSLMTVWACQAGKDVYVEKPISHNVFEGRQCVEAAKKYNRVVQHGTQNRSNSGKAKMMAAIHSGKYGKLQVAKGYCAKPRWSIGERQTEDPPATLIWDLWLGPAPQQPFHRNLVHYNWHWFWDTGNGDIGNQGVHEMDIARWGIQGATLPTEVWSLGGRFAYEDQGQTPNTQMAVYKFPDDVLLVFEVRGLVGKTNGWPAKVTNEFYTSEGVIRDGKFFPKGGKRGRADPIRWRSEGRPRRRVRLVDQCDSHA